jgi:hypothetical protein
MGGDGGTVAANRAYLRGAGKANHTADRARIGGVGGGGSVVPSHDDDVSRARSILHHCAITGEPLDHHRRNRKSGGGGGGIVVCPHGKLYVRERAIESLLARNRGIGIGTSTAIIGEHVRGMRDLHPARFMVTSSDAGGGDGTTRSRRATTTTTTTSTLTCPITGSDIGGGNVPCYVIVRCSKGVDDDDDDGDIGPNVLSERAIREMGIDGLQGEYGPFLERDMIRLAPPMSGGMYEKVRREWERRMESERIAKVRRGSGGSGGGGGVKGIL